MGHVEDSLLPDLHLPLPPGKTPHEVSRIVLVGWRWRWSTSTPLYSWNRPFPDVPGGTASARTWSGGPFYRVSTLCWWDSWRRLSGGSTWPGGSGQGWLYDRVVGCRLFFSPFVPFAWVIVVVLAVSVVVPIAVSNWGLRRRSRQSRSS